MPGFRKPQPELVERFDELASLVEADRKLIFGSPACVLHGNMFTALHDDWVRRSFAYAQTLPPKIAKRA
ncbi:MAG: hypothetical protein QOI42_535 [Frankiaceae bacterium]|nr:hypothetical protein [Frankiaceae bacterium]